MGHYDEEQDMSLTVLDRLLEWNRPGRGIGNRARGAPIESLMRDLQILLNTRREEILISPEFEECKSSILCFGVPDLTQCGSLLTNTEQRRVCNWLEDAIRLFEPRLRNVSVHLLPADDQKTTLRFRLEAKAELASGRIAFDMGLKKDTGEFTVSPGGEA